MPFSLSKQQALRPAGPAGEVMRRIAGAVSPIVPFSSGGMNILERLKSGTRELHEILEAQMCVEEMTSSIFQYRKILIDLASVWFPAEEVLATSSAANIPELELKKRLRADRLLRDINLLPGPAQRKNRLPYVTPPDPPKDLPEALGMLYVLEGSRMGGKVILKELRNIDISPDWGGSFFRGYGEKTGEMWERFARIVTEQVDESSVDRAIDSANSLFQTFIDNVNV